ncbi:MAG TPA: class I SAM-dependent methyltransferase, partial [bacterium]|nr:class I SAM-dependent methyltransferase [bacterium]
MKNSAPKRHARMVDDARRTAPLLAAVKGAVKAGDIVLDIGTGTGLLAVAAAKAGASRVLAIDCDAEALDSARASAEKASVDDVITFVEALSFDTKLKRRADVVLCETVGSFAFDENILATLSDAKRRLLKSGGLIVPVTLELWGSPISRLPKTKPPSDTGRTKREDMLSAPSRLAGIDFSKFIPPELHMKPQCKCTSKGTVLGIAVWP